MSLYKKLKVVLLACLFAQFTLAQRYTVHKKKISYFGFTGGISLTIPKVTDSYSVLSSLGSNYDENLQKEYGKFHETMGVQFGARYSYNFTKSISVSAGFGYQSSEFKYLTSYSWIDTLQNRNFDRELHHLQKISYFTLPIMMRWDMTIGQLMPYLQGGMYMDFRHQAQKDIHYDNTIDGEETQNQTSSTGMVSITDYIRKFNMGVMGGVGISYHTKFVTFELESNFRYGFFKVVNDDKRYADLNGFALQYLDVLDQLKLSAITIQLAVKIPLKNAVKSNILRRRYY